MILESPNMSSSGNNPLSVGDWIALAAVFGHAMPSWIIEA
jgi:hypothetical protein